MCSCEERFQRFFLNPGASCAFSSICASALLTGVCSRGCPRAQESADGGGGPWGRPWLGLNRAHLSGSPSSTLARQGPAQGERGYGGVLLWSSVSNGGMLYDGSGFRHNIPIYRAPPSLRFLQDVSSQPTAVLCLGLLSRPHIPAPSPCLQQWTLSQAGWAGQGSVPCVQVSLCPAATDCCRILFPQRMRLPFCPNWAPLVRAFPGCGDLTCLQIAPRFRSHCNSSPVPFPSCQRPCRPFPFYLWGSRAPEK